MRPGCSPLPAASPSPGWATAPRAPPARWRCAGSARATAHWPLGAIAALASGGSARPWLAACAASDAADLIATLVADGDELPARAKPGTVMAAGAFGAAGAALALSSAAD